MPDQAVTVLLAGSGVAGVWLLCIILGVMVPGWVWKAKEQEVADLKAALEAQTRRADAATEAVNATNLILAGIRREARDQT